MRSVRHGFTLVCLSLLLCGLAVAPPDVAYAQDTTRSFIDGIPTFTRIDSSRNVTADSVIQMVFTRGQDQEAPGFRLHLRGRDRTFGLSARPEDFNQVEGQPFYLITDGSARRAFVIRASDGGEVAVFRGETGGDRELVNPVAGRAFLNPNDTLKVIVTDNAANRVLLFDYLSQLVEWSFPLNPDSVNASQLNQPSAAVFIKGRNELLICDSGNNRILHVAYPSRNILSTITHDPARGDSLLNPVDVEFNEGDVLVTDRDNHRVVIFDINTRNIIWQFGIKGFASGSDSTLRQPEDAQFLRNGNILIADGGNQRLIEVSRDTRRIVWRFESPLPNLKSAYRLDGSGNRPTDTDKTLVVTENRTERLGYQTNVIEGPVHVLLQPVDFDSLDWQVTLPTGTNVRFQFRTANTTAELGDAPWLGPDSLIQYYTRSNRRINQRNDGRQIYQYRVLFETNNPLLTPVITQVQVFFHFFDTQLDGSAVSAVIRDTEGQTITSWERIEVNTRLPRDVTLRNAIELTIDVLDAQTNAVLLSFAASKTGRSNVRTLEAIPRTVQAIRLRASLETNNSSVSPILDNWRVIWRPTEKTPSQIRILDESFSPIQVLRAVAAAEARPQDVRRINVRLRDPNLNTITNSITVEVTAQKTGDRETATLELQPSGFYLTPTGIPLIIQQVNASGNGQLEVDDRDSVRVRYVDPTDPSDVSTERLYVLRFTRGELFLENQVADLPAGTILTFNDTLFVRVRGELDKDVSVAQDTIFAEIGDNITGDIEDIMLLEVQAQGSGNFSTGEFRSIAGIPIRNRAVGVRNDGHLQTRPNNEIFVRYRDPDPFSPHGALQRTFFMEADSNGGGIDISGTGAFDFFFAPNPYRSDSNTDFRLRMEAYTGSIRLEDVEIFNLAGERIRSINPTTLNMDRGIAIGPLSRSTSRGNWWDLRTEEGSTVSSGTYWARFTVFFDDRQGESGMRSLVKKFILVR